MSNEYRRAALQRLADRYSEANTEAIAEMDSADRGVPKYAVYAQRTTPFDEYSDICMYESLGQMETVLTSELFEGYYPEEIWDLDTDKKVSFELKVRVDPNA